MYSLIFVSDFHLSDNPTASSHTRDERFAALLDDLTFRFSGEKLPLRLVILGDFLDFLHTLQGVAARKDTSVQASLSRLDRITAAHPLIFEALRRFAWAGCRIDFLPGNHDPDLARLALQQRLREIIVGPDTLLSTGLVNFFPWIYYIPGTLYAEHGHLHHDINSVATLLAPYSYNNEEQIELPLGAHFEFYLYDLIEKLSLTAPVVERPLASLSNFYRKNPFAWLTTLPFHLRFLAQGLKYLAGLVSPKYKKRRAKYRQELLVPYAHTLGLESQTVIAIDRLAEATPASILRRMACLAARPSVHKIPQASYLFQAARSIHQILQAESQGVPYYIFGHTHHPSITLLTADTTAPAAYVNCGTWIEISERAERDLLSGFPYVQINRYDESTPPDAKLCFWR